jgi:O-antigen/teichoic acid export membrane protein
VSTGAVAATPGRHILRLRDVGLIAPAYAIPGIASFATVPILFATLGAAEYGEWALLYGIAAGVPQVTTSWLEATVVRFGHRRDRASDGLRVAVAVAGSILVSTVLVVLVVPGSSSTEVVAGAALTTVISLYVLSIARLQSALAFGMVSVAASVRSILGAILAIAGAILSGSAAVSILGLAMGYVLGGLIGRSVGEGRQTHAQPTAGAESPAGSAAAVPKERLSYGFASGVGAVASYTLSVGDRFILSAMRPLAEVGTYTATYALVDLAGRFVPSILLISVRPRLFRAWDEGRRAEPEAAAVTLAALVAWSVAGSTVVLLGLSQLVPGLPVDVALVGPIAIGIASLTAANAVGLRYSAATEQPRLATHLAVAAAINIALNIALIPQFGATGAAAATAASYIVLLGLNLLGAGLRLGRDRRPMLIGLATVGAFGAISVLAVQPDSGWPMLLAVGMLALAAPLVLSTGRRLRGSV